jgi:serine/threonine protein kinase
MPDPSDPSRALTGQNTELSSATNDMAETAVGRGTPPPALRSGARFGAPAATGEVGVLGPYRLVKELGRGGMGAVYLALDTRLDRKLALKVMLPEFATDREARERFLREAKAAAKIGHDNVVTVFEADERDGLAYIAMQFLQGYPLDEYLKTKGAPPLPHVLRIGREAALGLSAAHEHGLVHRDVKPANLWLEAPNGRVKVLDFGLAKPVGTDAELTKDGAVVGTPAYMSPEQARGVRVDYRTDLFSLGAVLYRLCTGRSPFTGPNVMAVLMALGSDDPTPVRELNPQVPEALAELIHQLLAKNPWERPQTAAEVARRLRAILEQLVPGGSTDALPAQLPSAPGADLSTSMPVVIGSAPALPPAVAPLHITAEATALGPIAEEFDEPKPGRSSPGRRRAAEPADEPPHPKPGRSGPIRRPPARPDRAPARLPRTGSGLGMRLAAVVAVLAVAAAGYAVFTMYDRGKTKTQPTKPAVQFRHPDDPGPP